MSTRFERAASALATAILAAYPTRRAELGFWHRDALPHDDLEAGHYSVSSLLPREYGHPTSESGIEGATHVIEVAFQAVVDDETSPPDFEAIELAAAAEIESLIDSPDLPAEIAGLEIVRARRSAALEFPYAWVVIGLEHPLFS